MNSPTTTQSELFEGHDPTCKRRKRDDSGQPQFKDYELNRGQHQLFYTIVFELLPQEHDCFLFAELIAQLDTREADKHVGSLGQRAYDSWRLIGILSVLTNAAC